MYTCILSYVGIMYTCILSYVGIMYTCILSYVGIMYTRIIYPFQVELFPLASLKRCACRFSMIDEEEEHMLTKNNNIAVCLSPFFSNTKKEQWIKEKGLST